MNPALNQYPRPILTLVRKRFKQRDKRHFIVKEKTSFWVSAKRNWLRRPSTSGGELWGELDRIVTIPDLANALASSVVGR